MSIGDGPQTFRTGLPYAFQSSRAHRLPTHVVNRQSAQMSWASGPPVYMRMLRVIPLLDKEGARGWLIGSICAVRHHPRIPSSAEEGSYFHDRVCFFGGAHARVLSQPIHGPEDVAVIKEQEPQSGRAINLCAMPRGGNSEPPRPAQEKPRTYRTGPRYTCLAPTPRSFIGQYCY